MGTAESQRHARFAEGFTRVVADVADWDAPTPVAQWQARDVVDHLVTWLAGFLAAGGVDLDQGPSAPEDPVGAWRHHAGAVQQLLETADADRDFTHPHLGTMPLAVAIDRFYTTDVFMHTWDLARSAGVDPQLDPDECEQILEGMRPMEQVLRQSGQYGPAVAVPDDAPVQDRLIGFIGRDPAWAS